jgi:hypothetical protein
MTAVSWLQDTWLNYPDLCTYEKIQEWFEQAKAMEKEQHNLIYKKGYVNGVGDTQLTNSIMKNK